MADGTRVLHVGNTANNAWNNAKWLNRAGVPCDALSYDYTHCMGYPEWDDAIVLGEVPQLGVDWSRVALADFERPDWWSDGTLDEVLERRRAGGRAPLHEPPNRRADRTAADAAPRAEHLLMGGTHTHLPWLVEAVMPWLRRHAPSVIRAAKKVRAIAGSFSSRGRADYRHFQDLSACFARLFPDRGRLTPEDIAPFAKDSAKLREIFAPYSVVQCAGYEPIQAMLAGTRPYIAYEHGTMRLPPFEESTIGRLMALAHRLADWVLITNADALDAVRRLGITRYSYTPHAIDVERLAAPTPGENPDFLRRRYGADHIVFSHVRLDRDKRLDVHIAAMRRIVTECPGTVRFVFTSWGNELGPTEQRLREAGLRAHVRFVRPMPKRELARWLRASDLVLEQMKVGVFGASAPESMSARRPVVMHYREDLASWCYARPAPVVRASNAEEVASQVLRLLAAPELRRRIGEEGNRWVRDVYSVERMVAVHREAYAHVRATPLTLEAASR